MGINLNEHGWNEVAETNDQNATAQVAAETLSDKGEKKSPANSDEKILDNKENNSVTDYNTTAAEIQIAPLSADDKAGAIREIITNSKRHIFDVTNNWEECRHIELETFAAFEAGYLSRFIHPSAPNTMPTPRFIFPLGDANDPPSFNAILSPSGRERFKNSDRWEHKNKCLTAGQKLLFNPSALKEKIVVVVEGEFDCVSLWQSNHKSKNSLDTGNFDHVGFCALGGAGMFTDFIKRLSAMEVKPKIIILFDKDKDAEGNDGAGIIDGRKLKENLLAMHVLCSVQFFEDVLTDDEKEYIGKKCDANAILISKGEDFLFWRLNRLVKRAVADFKQLEDEFARLKEYEQEQSGKSPFDDYVPSPTRKQNSTAGGNYSDEAKRAAIDKLADDIINTVTAEMLEQKGIITHSARGAARPNGYACNFCGSGTKHEKTGGLNFTPSAPTAFYCQACHEGGNVIQFLSKVWNIDNHGKSYFELIQKIADTFGFSYDPSIFEPPKSARENIFAEDVPVEIPVDNPPVDTVDPQVAEWEEIHGKIDPQLLQQLSQAVRTLEAITPENLTVEIATSSNTLVAVALCKVYDWNAAIAQKFFVALSDAKKFATAQIKTAAENSGFVAEPPEEIKIMATLPITEIKTSVQKLVSDISKRQKNFAAQWESKQRQNKALRKLEEYNQKLPTTQKVIPTCPVDLILPSKIFIAPDGCGTQYFTSDGIRTELAAMTPAVVTKVFYENGTAETQYEVAVLNRGRWNRRIVNANVLTSPREVGNLAAIGLLPMDTKKLADYFCRLIAANENTIPEIKCYSQTGWTDENFSEFIYPTKDADYIVRRNGFEFDKELGKRGNAMQWKKIFVEAMKRGGAVARIFTGIALAAPLVQPFNLPNLQAHLYGDSGSGKTALTKLDASIYGNPKGLIRTFAATQKNLQAIAAAYNDLPTFVDEVGALKPRDEDTLSKNVYDFSSGKQNQAQQKNGDTRPLVQFSGTRLSTGERTILNSNDPRGSFKRLLQLPCEKMFDDSFAEKLHVVSEMNFGHFGRPWVEYVANHFGEICADYQSYSMIVLQDKKEFEPTLIKSVVAAAVGFQYFMICSGEQSEIDENTLLEDIQSVINILPTIYDMCDDTRALNALSSFVASHPKNFVTEAKVNDDRTTENAAWNSPTFGKHFASGEVAFYPTELEKILRDEFKFQSAAALVDTWLKQGKLIADKGRKQRALRIGKNYTRTICFQAGILSKGYELTLSVEPPFPPEHAAIA